MFRWITNAVKKMWKATARFFLNILSPDALAVSGMSLSVALLAALAFDKWVFHKKVGDDPFTYSLFMVGCVMFPATLLTWIVGIEVLIYKREDVKDFISEIRNNPLTKRVCLAIVYLIKRIFLHGSIRVSMGVSVTTIFILGVAGLFGNQADMEGIAETVASETGNAAIELLLANGKWVQGLIAMVPWFLAQYILARDPVHPVYRPRAREDYNV